MFSMKLNTSSYLRCSTFPPVLLVHLVQKKTSWTFSIVA